MIVAERKPLDEIEGFIEEFGRVLVVGCGGCATVCLAGGETEVKIVGSALRIAARKESTSSPRSWVTCRSSRA
jgi:hypothetical protein